ncbi:hypothetical protein [Streptomyces sp. NPDC001404]|uniref:hypothetical protein n=1 Tax=Streptomyces sp. NPDC001404 TaxID=3364571 RepID=UPI0036B60A9F
MRHFFDADKPVGHTCHAVIALAPLGFSRPVRRQPFPAPRPRSRSAGAPSSTATMVSVRDWSENAPLLREIVLLLRQRT